MTQIWQSSMYALIVILAMGVITWLYSLYRKDVSIVDSLWSLMLLAAATTYLAFAENYSARNILLLVLVTLWALRLSFFLTVRNWNKEEDRRYREIRANNEPNFGIKSLYIVFGLQGVLAWIISIPLLLSFSIDGDIGVIEMIATALWVTGFLYESIADWQLYRFKLNSANKGEVLDTGLWAYSRHPNYFGEFLVWWAYFLFALSMGAWWTVFSPILMTLLLLKVSGVSLMEKGITERRADYRRYIETTNAFIPGMPRRDGAYIEKGQQS
jgi:steroid 5-alpha reductase family enzyme